MLRSYRVRWRAATPGRILAFDLIGRRACRGHIQCDAIIMDSAVVISTPRISAYHEDAQLVHEAAIGRLESQ